MGSIFLCQSMNTGVPIQIVIRFGMNEAVNGRPEGKAVITSLENLGALIESESGTIIQKD